MDLAHPFSIPMIEKNKIRDDPYKSREEKKEVIDKQHYITAVGGFT